MIKTENIIVRGVQAVRTYSDAYHNGDKVTYNGTRYICIAPDGVACVWNPDTYPAYWQEVT